MTAALDRVLDALPSAKRSGSGYVAQCPAHDDQHASLSASCAPDGKVLLHCHAGCAVEQIVAAMRLEMTDLFPPTTNPNGRTPGNEIVATYDYVDETGNLLFQTVRFEPKDFKQRRPDGAGGWVWKLGNVRRVLYRLPALVAADPAQPVYVCEGEKDADRLVSLGLIATTNPMGAGKWLASYSSWLAGRQVVLLQDNDPAGHAHVNALAQALHRAGSVRVVALPGLPPHGDVSDWLDAGGTADELARLATAQPDRLAQTTSQPNVPGVPTVYSARQIVEMTFAPPRWAVPGLMPQGLILLAGRPKMGKSWLALGLCLAIAYGGRAFGSIQVEGGEVLYLALEDRWARIQDRLVKLGGEKMPEQLYVSTDWPRMDREGLPLLTRWLSEHTSTRLVVVDTLAKFRPRVVNVRSLYDEDYQTGERLKVIADEHNVTVLVIHHLRKMAAEDVMDTVSGTLGLTGVADGTLVLARERGRHDATLHLTGRDVDDQELALRWDPQALAWCLIGNAAEYRESKERAEIKRVLLNAGEQALTPKDVAGLLDKNHPAVKKLMWLMSKAGEIKGVGEGRYMAVTADVQNFGNPGNRGNRGDRGNAGTGYPVTPVTSAGTVTSVTSVTGVPEVTHDPVTPVTEVTEVTTVTMVNGNRTFPPAPGGRPGNHACPECGRSEVGPNGRCGECEMAWQALMGSDGGDEDVDGWQDATGVFPEE